MCSFFDSIMSSSVRELGLSTKDGSAVKLNDRTGSQTKPNRTDTIRNLAQSFVKLRGKKDNLPQ